MAKSIATVSGVALKPGVSLNRRWYTRPAVAAMVQQAQQAIENGTAVVRDGVEPLAQLSHHEAGDDSSRIVGRLTSMTLDEDGNARYTADIADTEHGRTMASLLDTSDGKPAFLKGVSIRGAWKGTVRKVRGPDGKPVETADGIELLGLDYTKSPGVPGAGVDTFAWASRSGRSETTERVLITESVQEAHVTTFTEETGTASEGSPVLPEAALEAFAGGHLLENGICVTCEGGDAPGDGSKPYGNVTYADPGYQSDKKKRYPVDTKNHARAAWAYLAKKANAAKYTSDQLSRVKARIVKALKKFGVTIGTKSSAESAGWTLGEPVAVSEALAGWWPGEDPQRSGSYCLTAGNGPTSLTISSCCLDPEDLDPILRQAADAACQALAALDPDMDGDIDVPGADHADTDHDGGHESAPGDDTTETSPADEAGEDAAPAAGTEEEAVSDTANTETAAAAPATVTLTREQFDAMLARVAAPATETAPVTPVTPAVQETAPVTPAAETREQHEARLSALVEAAVAKRAAEEGLTTEETDETMIARLVERQLTPLRQAAAERDGTGTQRKGLLENIAGQAPGSGKVLQEASGADLAALAGAAYAPRR